MTPARPTAGRVPRTTIFRSKGDFMEPQISTQVAKTIVSEKTAPRVTEESIKAKIADVTYYVHDCLTVCIITMRNGDCRPRE